MRRLPPVIALAVWGAFAGGAGCKGKSGGAARSPAVAAAVTPALKVPVPAPHVDVKPPGQNKHGIRHVIIISEDGLRPDALMNARPPVHDAIMLKGAFSLKAQTIRLASTLPSHAAMLSGFGSAEHGLDWNSWKPERGYILVPTIFDAAEHAGDGSAAFVGKRKLQHITRPGSVDIFSRPGFFCKKVVEEAARYFVEKKPRVEFVHFSDPDERGHAVGWMSDPQLEAIRHSDKCLGRLVDAVTAAGMDGETLFILSSDHGGHGRNHSGRTKEDRLIPWIVWGPGVKRGYRIEGAISTVDTAATALWALGYPSPPGMVGRPVLEAFVEPVAAAAPKRN